MRFNYELLLAELSDLGAEKVEDEANGDYVSIALDFRSAVTVTPGEPNEKTYFVEITDWDPRDRGTSGTFAAETDKVEDAIESVREAYRREEERMEREDACWTSSKEGRS